MSGSRSRVVTRAARPADLPAVLGLVRQRIAEAHAEDVLTGHAPPSAAAAGFRRLLSDPAHRVVLAVLPGPNAAAGTSADAEVAVGLAVLGVDPLSLILGAAQVTIDTFVVHRDHRRRGAGVGLLAAAADYARERGAAHVVAAVGGHEAERQRFFSRMGFAPLTTRRIAALDSLNRSLAAWQRSGLTLPAPRRSVGRRRAAMLRPVPGLEAVAEG